MTKVLAENEQLRKENARLTQENELLRQKVDALARKVFGKSSEQLNADELQLLLEGIADEPKKPESDGQDAPEDESSQVSVKPKGKRKSRQATLPADLPVEEMILIPEEVQENPELYREVEEEVTEKLDYQPAQFKRQVTRRKKFVKKLTSIDDPELDRFFIAPLPPSLKEKSLLTPRLAAEIATNRFCYHLPYYRQEQLFLTRHGVHLPRNTMSQWMGDLAHDYLSGIYRAMHDEMLQSDYLQADETPIDYLSPGSGETQTGYLWTISHPDLNATNRSHSKVLGNIDINTTVRGDILFQWHEGRSAECLESLLRSDHHCFIGTLQTDAYRAYQSYQNTINGLLTLIACLAHIRRKFYEARGQRPKLSGWFLRQIRHLYVIEADLRRRRAGPAERERVRNLESLPIYHRVKNALEIIIKTRRVLPKSGLGKALSYAQSNWEKLEPCFTDGRYEIDNNLVENGIRPTKLGAKNWLFMGSATAGKTNAIWFTLIESCRRRKLDPWKYLVWIFTELPKLKVNATTFHNHTPKAYEVSLRNVTPHKKAS